MLHLSDKSKHFRGLPPYWMVIGYSFAVYSVLFRLRLVAERHPSGTPPMDIFVHSWRILPYPQAVCPRVLADSILPPILRFIVTDEEF